MTTTLICKILFMSQMQWKKGIQIAVWPSNLSGPATDVSVSVIILLIVIVARNYFVYCQCQYFQSKIKYMWQFHCFSPSISLKCQKRPKVFKHKFIYRENKEIHKWRVIHVLDLILYTSPGIVPLFPWVEWLKSLPSYQIPTLDVSGNIQTINLWY